MNKLELTTEGERFVIAKRRFQASPEEVYRAFMEPTLIQKWMLGPDGWTMPVCINENRVGGKLRYEWSNGKGGGFYLTGELLQLEPPHRIVHVERMHLPDPTPDNHIETTFTVEGTGTLVTMRMSLPDATTRRAMLATGMERGMEASYARLEQLSGWTHASCCASSTADQRTRVNVSIDVPDLEAGLRFHGQIFGFRETSRPFPTMAIVDANNVTVCMHEKPSGSKSSALGAELRHYERHWTPVHLDFHTHELDGALAKVRDLGGVVENEFRNHGPKAVAFCSDPFGNGFCIIADG